jgi:hypothetical protein
MNKPKNILSLSDINKIVQNTLTNESIEKNGMNLEQIKDKYFYLNKIKDDINEKIKKIEEVQKEDLKNQNLLKLNNVNIQIIKLNEEIEKIKNNVGLNLEGEIAEGNIQKIIGYSNKIEALKKDSDYLVLIKKEEEFIRAKKQNLIDLSNELKKFTRYNSIFQKDQKNLDVIENKIKDIENFIARDKFKNIDEIKNLIDLNAMNVEPSTSSSAIDENHTSMNDAMDNEIAKHEKFVEIKANLIMNFNQKINRLFDQVEIRNERGKTINIFYNLNNNNDLNLLIDDFECITQNSKNQKIHQKNLKVLRKFKTEDDDGSCYKFISKEIDLASLADGVIKIYYEGSDLVKEYRKLLIQYDESTNEAQKIEIQKKLHDVFEKLKKFNQEYRISFDNIDQLNILDIDIFNNRCDQFLQKIDERFSIGIHNQNNIKNLEYFGSNPSLTQKANIFKVLNGIGGDLIAEKKFWKDKGYFVDLEKRWFQFQDKNGDILSSRVVVRLNCDDPIYNDPSKKCLRVFYDEKMRSCTDKLMKDSIFRNQTIVESPYWAPDSWVRTSKEKTKDGKEFIAKVFSDEKMMIFLDSMPGFAVALKKIQMQDPKDPTKMIEVLRPTLFFNEKYQKIMEEGSDLEKSKLLKKVEKLYKDFVFATFDKENKKITIQLGIDELAQNAEFMSFNQTHEKLSTIAEDKAKKAYESTKSFVDNFVKKGFRSSDPARS